MVSQKRLSAFLGEVAEESAGKLSAVSLECGKGLRVEAWDCIERSIKRAERLARETPEQRAKRLANMKQWRERKKLAALRK